MFRIVREIRFIDPKSSLFGMLLTTSFDTPSPEVHDNMQGKIFKPTGSSHQAECVKEFRIDLGVDVVA